MRTVSRQRANVDSHIAWFERWVKEDADLLHPELVEGTKRDLVGLRKHAEVLRAREWRLAIELGVELYPVAPMPHGKRPD